MTYTPTFNYRKGRGFTLVELMVVLILMAILMAIGVPSYRGFILNQRLITTTADLRIALVTARSEAVKRNRTVKVLPNDGDWGSGWNVPSPEAGDPVLLNHVQTGPVAITGPSDNPEFMPSGRVLAPSNFEIEVGPEANKLTGCLRLRTDGRTEFKKAAC